MNLIVIAALVAVSSAAKLDRTYLPPASAKSAGGSPGSLQTPFPANSLNNGLGGLPKGGYNNEFQGVVVDAAAAGTRASEGDSSLGRPRVTYGSTESKVGDAAFKANENQFVDGQAAQSQNFQTGVQNQFNQFNHGVQSQNVRPRAELDRNANTVRLESKVGPENYHYAYETDNGISAEETGEAVNGAQAQGGFSYTGDDGQVYTVTYTADEGGFQPKGAHLPTPPPIPEEILMSLEQNARDEAAGLVDDGSYDARKYNTGGEYSENEAGKYHQSTFGHSETNAAAYSSQNNQQLRPSGHGSAQFTSTESDTSSIPQGHTDSSHSTFDNQNQHSQSSGIKQQYSSQASNIQNQYSAEPSQQNTQHLAQFSSNKEQFTAQPSGHNQYSANNAQTSSSLGLSHNFSGQNQQNAQQSTGHNQYSGNNAQTSSNFGQSHQLSGQNQQHAEQSTGHNQFSGNNAQASSSFGQTHQVSGQNQQHAEQSTGHDQYSGNNAQVLSSLGQTHQFSGQNQQHAEQSTGHDQYSGNNAQVLSSLGQTHQFSGQNQQHAEQSTGHNQYSVNNAQVSSSSFGQAQAPVAQPSFQQPQAFRPSSNVHSSSVSQSQTNSFGNKNEYLPPVSKPQYSSHISAHKQFNLVSTEKVVPLSQQNVQDVSRPQGPATNSFGQTTFTQSVPVQKYSAPQTSRPTFQAQKQKFSSETSQNEYSITGQSQAPSPAPSAQPEFNSNIQIAGDFQSQPKPQRTQASAFSQVSRRPQTTNQVNYQGIQGGQFQSTQGSYKTQATFGAQRPTAVPTQELTTPFETSPQHADAVPSATVASFAVVNTQHANNLPKLTQNNQANALAPTSSSAFASFNSQQSAKPQRPYNNISPSQAPAFPSQAPQAQFNQPQFGRPPQFTQNSQNRVTQFASSTAATFPQQPQGADDSYYYNQPSQPFNTPQGSAFSATQTNQFNTANQKPSYSQTNDFSSNSFSSQSQQFSGKYPRPPTIAPTYSSHNSFNGVTQASASSFPSEAPTQPTPSGQFPSRSSYQSNQFSQSQQSYYQPPAVINSPVTHQSQSEHHSSHVSAPSPPSLPQSSEIYQYNKPEESLPVQQQEATATVQFGNKNTKVLGGSETFNQYTQQQIAQYSQNNQLQSQNFGVQSHQAPKDERPVFGQKTQSFQTVQHKPKLNVQAPTAVASASFSTQSVESGTSVAGHGEAFGGPRNPPSFDAETGYHY